MLLAKNWWVFALRGALAIIFGLAAIFFPEAAFLSLVLVFGAFALVDGIFSIVSVFVSNAHTESWWWLVLEGVFGILIGVLTLFQPFAMGVAWITIIAIWAIVTGVLEIFTAIKLRKVIEGELWMIVSGVLSILFGVLAAFYPQSGAFAIGLIVGIYALMFGITFLMFAFRLRKHQKAQD
jgi:uncharacterized membrane protein HdeD (DUF308 family)